MARLLPLGPSSRCSSSLLPAAAALTLLLLCGTAAAQPQAVATAQEGPAATRATSAPPANASVTAPAAESLARFHLIVVFKDAATLAKQKVMCGRSALLYRLWAPGLGLPADCHMPRVCRRFYSRTILGFFGQFTDSDVARLERCLPGAVFYAEADGTVHKAEDDDFWHPVDPLPERPVWRGRAGLEQAAAAQPVQRQQRQQPQRFLGGRRSMLHAAAAAATGGGLGSEGPAEGGMPRVSAFEDQQLRVEAFQQQQATAGEGGDIDMSAFARVASPGDKAERLPSGRLWNLDRIDQRELPLDGQFVYGGPGIVGGGAGATVYVVDSGIRPTHQEFRSWDGRRVRASYGYDFVEDDFVAEDCDGHGTHVAATAVGLQVGVAKDADVVAVRILDCTGSGTISDTVAGLDWVAEHHKKPAIVTLSLGIQVGSWSRVLEDSVRSLINDHGITVVVASGNSAVDSCYVAPANVPEVISVAASNLATKYSGSKAGDVEDMYKWSNTGTCVDVFAPGVDIYSACGGATRCDAVTDSSYTYASGTSMAVPMVAGVAAVFLADNPDASPAKVAQTINGNSTPNRVNPTLFKPGTPNRLLYSRLGGDARVAAAAGPPASPP